MSEGFILPSQDVLLDAKNMVDQAHLLRIAFAGTSTQPGLIQRVEGLRPVVENLNQTLDEIRRLSATDAQIGSELGVQLAEISAALENFAKIVGKTVTDQFGDAFLAEQGQRLLIAVSQRLAIEGGQQALNHAVGVIKNELKNGAQTVADEALAEHHVRTTVELQAKNSSLQDQLSAANQKLNARIDSAMQNMIVAFFAGALVASCSLYFGPIYLKGIV